MSRKVVMPFIASDDFDSEGDNKERLKCESSR